MGRGKELVKNTGIIAVGKISTRFMSFFLLPLYTAVLDSAEFGVVDVFNTYVQLLLPIITLMIGQGAFRHLVDCEDDITKKKIVSTTMVSSLVLLGLAGIVFCAISPVWNNPYKLYLFFVLITAGMSDTVMQLARGFRKLNLYALGGVISSALQIIFNVILLTVLKMGPAGMFIATIIGNCACVAVLFICLKLYKDIKIKLYNRNELKGMLKYSVPLIPNQLSIWLLNSSDRFIVNLFLDMSANGILAVSHKFPMVMSSIYSVFQISWHETSTLHYNDPDRDEYFTETFHQVFRIFSALSILMVALLPIVYKWWIFNEEYREAYYTIPIYIIAVLFNIMVGFLGAIYVATKKTVEIAKTTMIVGIINVIVHVALINYIGLYAAAISTAVSYLIVLIYRMIDTKKYVKIVYDKKIIIPAAAVFLLVSVIYYVDNLLIQLIGVAVSVLYAGFINKKNIVYAFNEIKKRAKR